MERFVFLVLILVVAQSLCASSLDSLITRLNKTIENKSGFTKDKFRLRLFTFKIDLKINTLSIRHLGIISLSCF